MGPRCQRAVLYSNVFFFFQAEDGIRDYKVTGVQTCALPISAAFSVDVGLDYLTLDRLASTLSGGEAQRIQLATNLGSSLVGALYVLDEPSIGDRKSVV